MKKLTIYIVKKCISDWENTKDQRVRSRYGNLEGWISIVSNIVFTIFKAVFGLITGSVSLIADAFHSFSDVFTSVVIIITYRVSNKPPDKEHPYGHGRMEAIGTVIVSFILLFIALELLQKGFDHLINPRTISVSWLIIGLMIFSIIFKEVLARIANQLGNMIESDALKADAWHHRTDAISSVTVVIALFLQQFNIYFGDGLATVIISIMIGYTGVEFLLRGIDELLGKTASPEFVRKVKKAVRNFPQVFDMHDLIIHRYGQNVIGSLHIELSNHLSLQTAHAIADRIEKKLKSLFHMHITVHIDPVDDHDPELKEIRTLLNKISDQEKSFNFHELRVKNTAGKKVLRMELTVHAKQNEKYIKNLQLKIQNQIKKNFSEIDRVNCKIDPEYML